MNILVLLAGGSEPFEEQGYVYPKYLLEVAGKPLVEHVLQRYCTVQGAKLVLCIRRDHERQYHFADMLRLLVPDAEVVVVEGETRGAACTALLGIEHIDNDDPLFIVNGDCVIDVALSEVVNDFTRRNLDGGMVTFTAVHPRWSFVRLDKDGFAVEAAEKRPISKNATAGIYYFRRGHDFVEAAMSMIRKDAQVDGRFYVCPTFNELLLRQARVGVFHIEQSAYHSLAQPRDVDEFAESQAAGRAKAQTIGANADGGTFDRGDGGIAQESQMAARGSMTVPKAGSAVAYSIAQGGRRGSS